MFHRTTTFDKLINDIFSEPTTFTSPLKINSPNFRTYSCEDCIIYQISVPGFNKTNLDVDFEDDVITVKGKREIKEGDKILDTINFEKSFRLSTEGMELSKMNAEITDGILTINIPFEKIKEKKKSKFTLI